MFTWIHKNDWFKKKAAFVRSGKVEIISTFKRNPHIRKVLVKKTFKHVQEQKKAMSPRHSAYIPPSVKSPLNPNTDLWYKLFHTQKSNQNYCDKYCKKVTWCGRWFCNTPSKLQGTLKSSISFILKRIIIIICLTFLLQVVEMLFVSFWYGNIYFYFIYFVFTLFTVDLKLLIYTHKIFV